MGWRGTVRSMQAASRRAARDSERRRKHNEKMQNLVNAEATVTAFEEYLDRITGLHKDTTAKTNDDWDFTNIPLPEKPVNHMKNEENVQREIDNFAPNFFHKVTGGTERKKNKLRKKLITAREEDTRIFTQLTLQYEQQKKKWEISKLAASEDPNDKSMAYFKVIESTNTFAEIEGLGTAISIKLDDNGNFTVTVSLHGEDVIPDEKFSLRQSGTLSSRKMPKGEFNELYQDYVCSCVLRIALEIFSLILIEKVLINANDNLLNPGTGYLEEQTLLSVLVVRETVDRLNIMNIDPSDAMKNLGPIYLTSHK